MSDLFQGQTMTYAKAFISTGAATNFEIPFTPDKVVFNNYSQWEAVAGNIPISVWFRSMIDNGAVQHQVIDSAASQSFNFRVISSNGFLVVSTPGGQASSHAAISGITQADPGVITHSAYTFQTNQIVRLTDLGPYGIGDNGMGPLNNNRYKIVVLSPTTFSLKDVITGEPIDTSAFPAYVAGGRITLETHVISLNNPQVAPYEVTPYVPNPYNYAEPKFILRAGTGVMGTNGDYFVLEAYKFGQFVDVGQ